LRILQALRKAKNDFKELKIVYMKLRIFVCIVIVFWGLNLFAQTSSSRIVRSFVNDSVFKGSSVGIYVIDLSTGNTLIAENSQLLLAPASVLKILTSAAALEILGPDYRFNTDLGFSGKLDSRMVSLTGDLIIKGGGDPTLGSAFPEEAFKPDDFWEKWIAELKVAGIKKVAGNLVLDISVYEGNTLPGSWAWEDIGNYYGAAPSALSVFDNMVRLYFDSPDKPGEPVTLIRTVPNIAGITWQNEIKSSTINRDMSNVYGSPWGEKRLMCGTIPIGKKGFEVKASLPDPPLFLGNFLMGKFSDAGIMVSGEVKVTHEPQSINFISSHLSPSLSEILKIMNHESVNLFADHMVMQIALEKGGKGNLDTGLELIRSFWKKNGIRDTFFIEDGSGISRFDAISAKQMTGILAYMDTSVYSGVFKSSLPEAGKGTLSSFNVTDFPGRSLRCKSGSMDRVKNYAGYLKCNSGREVAFAILVNNFACTQTEVGRKIQRLLLNIKHAY